MTDHTTYYAQENFSYDAAGRMTDKYDQANRYTKYGFDALGRLTNVYLAPETFNLHTHYDYNQLGNRIDQIDANGNTTSFGYDPMGRRISHTLSLQQAESYTYDRTATSTCELTSTATPRRELPNAELHLFDTGHFALEEEVVRIGSLMHEFLGRTINKK